MQTEHDLIEHYKQIKKRLNNAAIIAKQKNAPSMPERPISPPKQIEAEPPKPRQDIEKFPLARQIIIIVSEKHGVTTDDIFGSCRKAKITTARMEVMSELYKTGKYSLCQIGRILRKNHTSVLHAVRKLKALDSGKAIEGS